MPHAFPRLQKRGPIEARRRQSSAGTAGRFHAYKSVAPLKLQAATREHREALEFPRLQKRGPIEAVCNTIQYCALPAGFHAYKSVAPLKHKHRTP